MTKSKPNSPAPGNRRPVGREDRRSEERAIHVVKRADLVIVPVWFQGQRWFVSKDPLSLEYCRLRADERAVLGWLDGHISWKRLKAKYDQQFTPERVSTEQLQSLVYRFHQLGLIVSDVSGQADPLLKRAREKKRRFWLGQMSSLLFLRFPGVDPDRFLRRLLPWTGWVFSPPAIVVFLAFCCAALMSVAVNLSDFMARLPELDQLLTMQSLLTTVVVISVTKVLHELGHGVACKYFGGECHQIGIMLLVFAPALYCDTSDSWLLPKKWQRALVGMAGMYVELILASVCTFIWWSTEPGWLHYLCVRIMMVASISTVLFNANPLLRYDGYFVLSDLWGMPNLADRSRKVVSALASRCLLGVRVPIEPLPTKQAAGFVVYAVASMMYRWLMVVGILLFVARTLRPYGLSALTGLYSLSIAAGLFVVPSISVARFIKTSETQGRVKWSRVATSAIVGLMVLAVVGWLPLRHRVGGSAIVYPANRTPVFVAAEGHVDRVSVTVGDEVLSGAPLIQLTNEQLEFERVRAEGNQDAQRLVVRDLKLRQAVEPDSAAELPAAEATLADLETQLAQRTSRIEALLVRAPRAGRIIAAPDRPAETREDLLSPWSGSPLAPENQSSFLVTGTQIASIGDSDGWEIEMLVQEGDRDFVQVGQPATIRVDASPGTLFRGTVVAMSRETVRDLDPLLASVSGGPVATAPATHSQLRPLFNAYLVRIRLHDSESFAGLHVGLRAETLITVGQRPIAQRIYDRLSKLLRFI